MNQNEKPIILLIDFANVAFSCWYSKPQKNSQGENINAIINFFSRLRLWKETYCPQYIVFATDLSRKTTFRRQMYPEYKAQRKEIDPDIANQMHIISNLTSLLGFPMHSHPYYEADDIVGMISKWADEHGYQTIIVSSDRDLYQLITPDTSIYSPKKGVLVDETYMFQTYNLTPKQWIDLKILQGDNSDNIPGIRHIGEKTAMELMRRYGSIENIYYNLNNIQGKVHDALALGESDIPLMRDLVTIVRDYEKIDMKESFLYRHEMIGLEIKNVLLQHELDKLWPVFLYALFPQDNDCLEAYHYDESKNNTD